MADSTEVDPLSASIALMEAQIARLRSAIDMLEGVRGMLGQAPSGTPSRGVTNDVSFDHDAFFGMTAAEAARKYLATTKKTASAKTIADALTAGGWKTASKNVPENIRTILNRHVSFVVVNGEFGLAEWYPGRKSRTKRVEVERLSSGELAVSAARLAMSGDEPILDDELIDPAGPSNVP